MALGELTLVNSWKLRNPEKGYSAGSSLFNNPRFLDGIPVDWVATQTVPPEGLKAALSLDENSVTDNHPLIHPPRSHTECFLVYIATNISGDPKIPHDGSHIRTRMVLLLPSSRGTVTLASQNPADAPVLDPNYYATEMDRYVMRTGLRGLAKMLLETKEGQLIVEKETTPNGFKSISSDSTDEQIDVRVWKGVE
jgi:choline dehydrogenase-like flavoprotein